MIKLIINLIICFACIFSPSAYSYEYNRPLAKVLFLTILDFDIYLKINAYH